MTEADLILVNGIVLTMAEPPTAEAVALAGDRILAVGARADVERLKGARTRVVDLRGRVLVPGFVDAHTHLVDHGMQLMRLNLGNVRRKEDFLAALGERARLTPEDGWIVGHSWDESKWESPGVPTREEIEAAAGGRRVVLARVDMHMGLASVAALDAAGLPRERFPDGQLREEDFYRVWDLVTPSEETLVRAVRAATRRSWELGVTSAHVIADLRQMAALERARKEGGLGVRCSLFLRAESLDEATRLGLRRGSGDDTIRVLGLKLFADGSIGSRTAAVSFGYADDPAHTGQLMYAPGDLARLARRGHEAGLQLAIHCIGDVAVRESLDAIEAAGARAAERPRLEHLELFTDADAARAASLGVIASAQPNFIGEWGHPGQMYEKRLGLRVVPLHNRLRVLRERGILVAFGSDHMPYGPLYGIHCAVNAPTDAQRLAVEEALAAYTIGAARAGFAEDRVGSIEPGKLADLVVLSEDPRRSPERIKDLGVEMTILGGRVVHQTTS